MPNATTIIRTAAVAIIVIALFLLAACGSDDPAAPTPTEQDTARVVFQDGLLPTIAYAGTRDAAIKNGPTDVIRNDNFGTLPFDTLGMRPAGAGSFESRVLLRFDVTSLTDCWYVVSAEIEIAIASAEASFDVILLETAVPDFVPGSWTEGTGEQRSGVSWLTVEGDVPWGNEGGDTTGGEIARATIAPGDTSATFPLPASLAQQWIARPGENHGVTIRTATPVAGLAAVVWMRESREPADRPALSIAYIRHG